MRVLVSPVSPDLTSRLKLHIYLGNAQDYVQGGCEVRASRKLCEKWRLFL
jgi:hypothetical protein